MEGPFEILDFDQLRVQIQVRPITPENFAAHLASESAKLKSSYANRDQIVARKAIVLCDSSCDLLPPPTARKAQAEWFAVHKELLGLCVQAMGFVVPNGLARGAMTALFWIAPMPFPCVAHSSLEKALDWALAELRSIDGKVPDELLRDGVNAIERKRTEAVQRMSARARAPSQVDPKRRAVGD